jgi:DNA mismatch repair ATPase MutS
VEKYMSVVRDKYNMLKAKDSSKIYAIRSGIFYEFLDDDAVLVSEIYNFKLNACGSSYKCGFPAASVKKYKNKMVADGINFIEEDIEEKINEIIKMLNNADLNNITPIESFDLLKNIKGIINE